MDRVVAWRLRAAFARSMARTYGAEVPAYNTRLLGQRRLLEQPRRDR